MSNKFSTKVAKNIRDILTLDAAETNRRYKITKCLSFSEEYVRLAEMGLVSGTVVFVKQKAPLGDPIEITVKGYSLCLRASDAKNYVIKEL